MPRKASSVVQTTDNIVASTATVAEVKTPKREYSGDDLIPCRSVTYGELICQSPKTGSLYRWTNFGDVTEVEYQDLMALRARNSRFIFGPMFVIEDEGIFDDIRWKKVKEIYDNMLALGDVEKLLSLPLASFRSNLSKLPDTLKKTVVSAVRDKLEAETFDSIQKVKAIDEICGTDLKLLM